VKNKTKKTKKIHIISQKNNWVIYKSQNKKATKIFHDKNISMQEKIKQNYIFTKKMEQ